MCVFACLWESNLAISDKQHCMLITGWVVMGVCIVWGVNKMKCSRTQMLINISSLNRFPQPICFLLLYVLDDK